MKPPAIRMLSCEWKSDGLLVITVVVAPQMAKKLGGEANYEGYHAAIADALRDFAAGRSALQAGGGDG